MSRSRTMRPNVRRLPLTTPDSAGVSAWLGNLRNEELDATEQVRKSSSQPFGDLFDIPQGYISNAALDTAVVRPVQSASLGRLFLVDLLRFAYATDGAAKSAANVERHRAR